MSLGVEDMDGFKFVYLPSASAFNFRQLLSYFASRCGQPRNAIHRFQVWVTYFTFHSGT